MVSIILGFILCKVKGNASMRKIICRTETRKHTKSKEWHASLPSQVLYINVMTENEVSNYLGEV